MKHYETKQYKKGLKAADLVLKKFPEHGETIAMKGECHTATAIGAPCQSASQPASQSYTAPTTGHQVAH